MIFVNRSRPRRKAPSVKRTVATLAVMVLTLLPALADEVSSKREISTETQVLTRADLDGSWQAPGGHSLISFSDGPSVTSAYVGYPEDVFEAAGRYSIVGSWIDFRVDQTAGWDQGGWPWQFPHVNCHARLAATTLALDHCVGWDSFIFPVTHSLGNGVWMRVK